MLLKSVIRFLSFQLLFSSGLAESHWTPARLRHSPTACGKYVCQFLGPFSEFLSVSRNCFWHASPLQDRHSLRGPYFPMLECGKLPQRKRQGGVWSSHIMLSSQGLQYLYCRIPWAIVLHLLSSSYDCSRHRIPYKRHCHGGNELPITLQLTVM